MPLSRYPPNIRWISSGLRFLAISPSQQLPEQELKRGWLNAYVVASQQQCADDLDIQVSAVRSAAARLIKRGLLTTPYKQSRALVTKHKLGVGFRASLSEKWVRAFRPTINPICK